MSSAEEIPQTLSVSFEPGQVVELRALKGRTTVSGYFDDHEALAEHAVGLDRRQVAPTASQRFGLLAGRG
jgi:hypothetical protein